MGIIVVFLLGMVGAALFLTFEEDVGMRSIISIVAVFFAFAGAILAFHAGKELGPDIQYIPAEYVAENETSTYFGTEDGNIFYVDRIPLINRNVPYLLGMDTQGTQDVTDDVILTVWELCE